MSTKTATLYRMQSDQHICPFGLKSRDLLKRNGYIVEEKFLANREQTNAFKQEHDVKTTPQTFIDGKRLGGFDDLQKHFGIALADKNKLTYKPVIAIFAVTALMAMAISWLMFDAIFTIKAAELFIAFSMCVLGIQKLRDLAGFQNNFITYDLLGMRYTPYAYIYAFAETGAGILMIAGALTWLSAPVALFIAGINGVSVIKAVYIDKRELKCACVGGNSNVPLGFISLTENVMMVLMAVWMLAK